MAARMVGMLGGERCDGCVFNDMTGCSVDEQEIADNLEVAAGQLFCGCFTASDGDE